MLPNFLVIGAMKAGTTGLYYTLEQHPQVYMSPIKEPHFFSHEGGDSKAATIVTSIEDYRALFNGVTTELAYGEASTSYLSSPKVPERIHHYIPDVKMIAILRDPVERAYSHFWYDNRTLGAYSRKFLTAFEKSEERRKSGKIPSSYLTRGLYYQSLTRYYQYFSPEQIKIFLYEDWLRISDQTIRDTFTFLGVDPNYKAKSVQAVAGGLPKSGALRYLISHTRRLRSRWEASSGIPKLLMRRSSSLIIGMVNRTWTSLQRCAWKIAKRSLNSIVTTFSRCKICSDVIFRLGCKSSQRHSFPSSQLRR